MGEVAQLGELLALADRQLRTAALARDARAGGPAIATESGYAASVARALGRYLDDVLADVQLEVVVNYDAGTRSQAAAQMRYALQMAESNFRAAATAAYPPGVTDPAIGGLADVAGYLTAGRDLLRTHFTTDQAGIRTPGSRWVGVIGSAAFTGALLAYAGRQSRQLAAWAARTCYVSTDEAAVSDTVRVELASAQQWLTLASTAAQASARHYPVTAADTMLLASVPANIMPAPRPLGGAEPLQELCDSIVAIAERLRMIARWRPGLAAQSPLATAESWRWLATSTAVASDMSEVILTGLAGRRSTAPAGQCLATAAQSAAGACARWRHAAATWKYMTTENRGLLVPGLADAGDLIVRLGRLAFADPQWAPGRSRHVAVRAASDIAADDSEAALVLAAVHHAADALAVTAAADHHGVEQVVAADRLYVPTRTLPETYYATGYGQPRPFGLALGEDKYVLCDAYAAAADASAQLAASLDVAAVMTGAPSTVLAVARAAGRVPLGAEEQAPVGRVVAERPERLAAESPVEAAVRRTGVKDPMMLFRAKMLDEAGRKLAAEAAATAMAVGQRDDRAAVAEAAVVTAGHSFPRLAGTRGAGIGQPERRSSAGRIDRPHTRSRGVGS